MHGNHLTRFRLEENGQACIAFSQYFLHSDIQGMSIKDKGLVV